MNKKLIKKNDIILAALLIAAAAAILIFSTGSGSASAAEVYSHGELIRTIDLEHVENEYTIELGGEYNIIIGVRKNGVRFVSSDCPDKLCVNSGWLTGDGQTATCLPAATYIKVVSGADDEIDAIAGDISPGGKPQFFAGGSRTHD